MDHPKRKSPRIPGYDYATPNYYFVTICTHDKKCIFGKPDQLNRYGKYAQECLLKIAELNRNVLIDKYVVMPNHVHAIIVIQSDYDLKKDIPTMIGQYKTAVTKQIRKIDPKITVWQRSFHDHVIRNQRQYESIWSYIDSNPLNWKKDCFYLFENDSVQLTQSTGNVPLTSAREGQ